MMRRKIKAQSTLEYAIVIAVVVAALLAMQIYMKRGVQGKLHESADQIGEQFDAGNTSVYSAKGHTGTTVQEVTAGATTTYTGESGKGTSEKQTESGNEQVYNW
jgi:hypothetical protein